MIGVYCFHNLINGKKYIGASINVEDRRRAHKSNHLCDRYSHLPFYCALKYYGWDNFVWGVIEECNKDELSEKERTWITHYDTTNHGYNCQVGNSENWNKNGPVIKRKRRTLSETHKRRLSESAKGRVIDKDTREKISQTLMESHFNISEWLLCYDNGETIRISNLKKWSRDNGYNFCVLQRMGSKRKGTHKDIISVTKLSKDP